MHTVVDTGMKFIEQPISTAPTTATSHLPAMQTRVVFQTLPLAILMVAVLTNWHEEGTTTHVSWLPASRF